MKETMNYKDLKAELLADPETELAYLKHSFGHFLRRYRIKHGISQRELARILGIHQARICQMENAYYSPSITVMHRITYQLGYGITLSFKERKCEGNFSTTTTTVELKSKA